MLSRSTRRRGLTLLEVILAIAILGGALAVIGELIRLGSRSAAQARDLTTAQLYCESKLNAIAAGIEEPTAISAAPLDESGEWIYFIEPQEIDEQGMLAVRVTVMQSPDLVARPVSFSLSRWIIDPTVEEAAAALAAEMKAAAQEALASANSGGSAGGGTGNAGPAGGQDPTGGGTGLPGGVGGPMGQDAAGGFGGFGPGGFGAGGGPDGGNAGGQGPGGQGPGGRGNGDGGGRPGRSGDRGGGFGGPRGGQGGGPGGRGPGGGGPGGFGGFGGGQPNGPRGGGPGGQGPGQGGFRGR
jgi:prepilin-type N-terminal cleavage/methylation domain-containing protein